MKPQQIHHQKKLNYYHKIQTAASDTTTKFCLFSKGVAKDFIYQNFNPKKLAAVIQYLLSQSLAIFKNEKDSLNKILNSPNFSLLFTNLKLYDDVLLVRENDVINMFKNKFENKFFSHQNNNKQDKSKQKEINKNWNYLSKNMLRAHTENNETRNKSNKGTNIQQVIQQLQLACIVFDIYQSRLKEIGIFVHEFTKYAKKANQNQSIQHTINELQKLCEILMQRLSNIKNRTKTIFEEYEQQTDKVFGQKKQYFISKNFHQQINMKTKNIQQKYTQISKTILERQRINRQLMKSEQPQINVNLVQSSIDSISQIQNESKANLLSIPNSSLTHLFLNSHLSILKNSRNNILNRLVQARNKNKNKNKRISIEIITDIAQLNRLMEARYLNKEDLNLDGGSFQNLLKKKGKKVKIETQFQDDSQRELSSFRSKNKSKSRGFKNSPSKSSLFNDECFKSRGGKGSKRKSHFSYVSRKQKKENNENDNESRFFSYDQIVTNRSLSNDNKSKSGNEVKSIVVRSKKRTSRNETNEKFRSRSLILLGNEKKTKTQNHISIKVDLSDQLKKIIANALADKKKKKNESVRMTSQNLQNLQLSTKTSVQKRNFTKLQKAGKLKVLNKDKQKQQYQTILNDMKNLSKEKTNQENVVKKVKQKDPEIKSSRRVGISFPTDKNLGQENNKFDDKKYSKTSSKIISNPGSRKFYFSNTRIKFEQGQERENRRLKQENKCMLSHSQPENRVNLDERSSILGDFVKFYPEIQCTLHKYAKKYDKSLMNSNNKSQNSSEFQMATLPAFSTKKYNDRHNYESSTKIIDVKKSLFEEENLQFNFSRKFATAFNQLQQRGTYERVCSEQNESTVYFDKFGVTEGNGNKNRYSML